MGDNILAVSCTNVYGNGQVNKRDKNKNKHL